jgi:hypothetical protein
MPLVWHIFSGGGKCFNKQLTIINYQLSMKKRSIAKIRYTISVATGNQLTINNYQ